MVITKKQKDFLYLQLGILGACITLFGLFKTNANLYHVIGSFLLLLTAAHYHLLFFIALEMILIAGHGTILLNIGAKMQVFLPLLLCLQLLFFYFFSDQPKNIWLFLGIAGIGALSLGFVHHNQWIFFAGGLCIAVYAFFISTRASVTLIWALLNILFAFTALIRLFFS